MRPFAKREMRNLAIAAVAAIIMVAFLGALLYVLATR